MKLAAIYNVWDGVELLAGSIRRIKDHIDLLIIVSQDVSNWGERFDPMPEIRQALRGVNVKTELMKFTPREVAGAKNETAKRNMGINEAKDHACTHFLLMDCDEYYEDFGAAKELYLKQAAPHGSACSIVTYFKRPTLRFDSLDGYFVPFIHPLHADSRTGESDYPHYVDPTRRINCEKSMILPVTMHHFSWVRRDIGMKARNSSAKFNLERGTMLRDHADPRVGDGFFVQDYAKKLVEVENIFGISI